ncbi:hypothetical protein Scep_027378 [Stephania cephalantha]|uniref:Uncharacterized protein n=1 Tax=Stephania cephalantha TaxID=152367 RepID=A0AAP0E7X1_9MAGN
MGINKAKTGNTSFMKKVKKWWKSKKGWSKVFIMGDVSKWRRLDLKVSFLDDVMFKIVSVFEALILVSALCFFYCFCGDIVCNAGVFSNRDPKELTKYQNFMSQTIELLRRHRSSPPAYETQPGVGDGSPTLAKKKKKIETEQTLCFRSICDFHVLVKQCTKPSGANSVALSVGGWFFDRVGVSAIDCPYPCDNTCHNLVSK